MLPGHRFSDRERSQLLATPRIGPLVVDRLESLGMGSFEALRHRGIDNVVDLMCQATGNPAWRNRRRPLQQALAAFEAFAPSGR